MFKCHVCGETILFGRKHKDNKEEKQKHSLTYDEKDIWCSGSFDEVKDQRGDHGESLMVSLTNVPTLFAR